jgi:hypothetical protein
MEIKKSKVLKVTQKKKQGVDEHGIPSEVPVEDKYGNHYYIVAFENRDYGDWRVKPNGKNIGYFVEGQEAEYTIAEDGEFNGQKQYKIGIPYQDKGFGGGGGSKYQPKKKAAYKADMISFGFSYAKDMQIGDKLLMLEDEKGGLTVGKFAEVATLLTKNMWKLLDEIEGLE